jgi:DNA-binding CsgD family transcriptional regulator
MDGGLSENPVSSATLQESIDKAIARVAEFSENFPAVIVIHHLPDFTVVYMSPNGVEMLGKKWEELKGLGSDAYHDQFFNPEDAKYYVPKISGLLESNSDETITFFQQVRTSRDREWDWYMSSIKILLRDDQNKPLLSINIAQKVDPENQFTTKAVRLLEENDFIRRHWQDFGKLGKREVSVLRLLALGKTAPEISKELSISVATAETHRKNIKRKLKTSNMYELSQYARAFNLI